jgi:ribosomal protein S18 acetylase RimI-like enzyme
MTVDVRQLAAHEWTVWRDLRLRSLADAPDAFCADVDAERSRSDEWWMDLVSSTVAHPRGALWCAEIDEEPVGIAFSRIDGEGVVHIGSMWVSPEGRTAGIGRALVESAVAWGRSGGASTAELWVTVGNGHAELLYERSGFIDTGDRDELRADSDLAIARMVRTL